MIPMVDLKTQYHRLKGEIDAALSGVLESTAFILGPNVSAFEAEAAEYLGVKHAISCASGTDALHLALLASGVGPGDEVITSAFTFIATAEAIRYVGATPVFVDIDPRTFNIDPAAIGPALTERTRAIMPVHLFGQPVDMALIQALCDAHDLILIEDCAQSFGATHAGRQTGSMGVSAGYSFFPSKNLGCYGDGGLVGTSSDDVATSVRKLRNHGSEVRYYHDVIGYNSRLDEMQAAILRVKLRHIEAFNRERRRVAHRYSELMSDLPLETPWEDGLGVHVYHQYTLLCDRRDAVMEALKQADIASAIYYPVPLHQQKVFAMQCEGLSLPVTESVAQRCLSLPIYPELEDADIQRIVGVIRSALDA
jgi:dTDP-4-amino-4,6-dideoxygalactose transaminase